MSDIKEYLSIIKQLPQFIRFFVNYTYPDADLRRDDEEMRDRVLEVIKEWKKETKQP